jgi:predicted transcriptional regulator
MLSKLKDLRARRAALEIPHDTMATGTGLSSADILSIEADVQVDGYESDLAEFYVYWLDRLERLTKEQLNKQIARARAGRRFR